MHSQNFADFRQNHLFSAEGKNTVFQNDRVDTPDVRLVGIGEALHGQNRQSPIASVQRTRSTLASHSAAPCGTNVKRVNAIGRAIRIATQRTQGL